VSADTRFLASSKWYVCRGRLFSGVVAVRIADEVAMVRLGWRATPQTIFSGGCLGVGFELKEGFYILILLVSSQNSNPRYPPN